MSLNDVRGGASATIEETTILATGGDILVQADENATLTSSVESELVANAKAPKKKSMKRGSYGSGNQAGSLAGSGILATNVVLSAATATITDSDITTQDIALGNVNVQASNTSTLTAETVNSATASGGPEFEAIGVTLAFNTVGWESQNVLFNFIDALIGDPLIANAFGANVGADATASLVDTLVDASGQVKVDAVMDGQISSTIRNTTSSSATGKRGTKSLSLGAVLSMNKISSKADAFITYTSQFAHPTSLADIIAGGGVSVTAIDAAGINSTIELGTTTDGALDATGVAGAVSLNDVRGGASATIEETTLTATGGDILVKADENATLTSSVESELVANAKAPKKKTMKKSSYGSGTTGGSLAGSGILATNVVLSAATTTIIDSNITTKDQGPGNVKVLASNTSTLTAETINSATASGGPEVEAIGVTLAFNTVGWESQNVLFNFIDALIGDPLIANTFGANVGADATASLVDTLVDAKGQVVVDAVMDGLISSTIGNTTSFSPSGKKGSKGLSLGAVLSMNKISSKADAFITYTSLFAHPTPLADIIAGNGVSVTATDSPDINSMIDLKTGLGLMSDQEVDDLRPGDRVKLVEDLPSGKKDEIYEFVGPNRNSPSPIILSSENYAGDDWKLLTSGTLDATGVAGAVSLNDVRGGASATIEETKLTATGGQVLVKAEEIATLTSTIESELVADATAPKKKTKLNKLKLKNLLGSGPTQLESLAVSGILATNVVLSRATATITDSNITTQDLVSGTPGRDMLCVLSPTLFRFYFNFASTLFHLCFGGVVREILLENFQNYINRHLPSQSNTMQS